MLQWYVLRTERKRERYAAAGLQRQGFETYLPLIRSYKRQSDKRLVKVLLPIFERYLFVKLEWHRRSSVLATRGVLSIVGYNERTNFAPYIRKQEMRHLKQRLGTLYEAKTNEDVKVDAIAAGDLVQILLGPYAGKRGPVVNIIGSKIAVLLRFANAQLPVKLQSSNIARVA